MKRLAGRLSVVFLLFFVTINALFAADKVRVVVFNFSPKGVEPLLAESVTENFVAALIEQRKFTFIERKELDKIFAELNLQSSEDFDESSAVNVGRLAGADLVLLGNVTRIGDNYTINVRGVDIETGEAKFAKRVTSDDIDDLLDMIEELVEIIGNVNLNAWIYKGPCDRERLQIRYFGERWGELVKIPATCELPAFREKEHFKIETVKRFNRRYYNSVGENCYEIYDEERAENHLIIYLDGTLQDAYIVELEDEDGYDIFLIENGLKVHRVLW